MTTNEERPEQSERRKNRLGRICPVCGAPLSILSRRRTYVVAACQDCRFSFSMPRATEASTDEPQQ